ncbi:MAG TPA: flavoprotein [Cerasibacillus sp.]|uniref:flavoprotein n=1 Tax=Cerasibacillus sp. TaxID=2498711 RepID=UPI002F3F0211
MDNSFRQFLDTYLDIWRNSPLTELSQLISKDYKAREITGENIVDFGYEESINGWEQGFNFVKENNAQWILNEISVIPLRIDEKSVILSATMIVQGKSLETSNLFFQTFKKNNFDDWKLVRNYVEVGVLNDNLNRIHFN